MWPRDLTSDMALDNFDGWTLNSTSTNSQYTCRPDVGDSRERQKGKGPGPLWLPFEIHPSR